MGGGPNPSANLTEQSASHLKNSGPKIARLESRKHFFSFPKVPACPPIVSPSKHRVRAPRVLGGRHFASDQYDAPTRWGARLDRCVKAGPASLHHTSST